MAKDQASKIQVRRATSDDLRTLVEFNAAMAQETEGKILDLERLRAGVAAVFDGEGRGCYYVAQYAERVVGQLLVTTEWSDWRNAYFWWIQSVYVTPEFRRMGVYRMLYGHVMTQSRLLDNVSGLRLYVYQGNSVAKKVYTSMEMRQSNYQLWEIDYGF